jgi:NAD(P)H-nitrite reductase large subunit
VVTGCVCFEVSFERLKAAAAERGLDLAGLKKETGCCTGCGLCEPYVRLMLATGRTRFAVLSPGEAQAAMRPADIVTPSGPAPREKHAPDGA